MTFPIRVVAIADDGQEPVHGITSLQRTELKMETLGLTLAEGKAIHSAIQRVVVEAPTAPCVAAHRVNDPVKTGFSVTPAGIARQDRHRRCDPSVNGQALVWKWCSFVEGGME